MAMIILKPEIKYSILFVIFITLIGLYFYLTQSIECVYCKESMGMVKVKCDACDGKAKIQIKCPDCSGKGEKQCPDCLNSPGYNNCDKCSGKGSYDCDKCSGKGSYYCNKCDKGYSKCKFCEGNKTKPEKSKEIINCPKCNGDGLIEGYVYNSYCDNCKDKDGKITGKITIEKNIDVTCNGCSGSGVVKCEFCGGTCKLICDKCEGNKIITCEKCKSVKTKCSKCNGSGIIKCSNCNGEKHVFDDCLKCKKTGILTINCPQCKGTRLLPRYYIML